MADSQFPKACDGCRPEYGDCLNAGCFLDIPNQLRAELASTREALTQAQQERDKWLKAFNNAERHIQALEGELARHAEAASVFQTGGELHEAAGLKLGDSTVVDGLQWIIGAYREQAQEIARLKETR